MEHIGAGFLLQSLDTPSGDKRYLEDEMRLAVLSEELGFDFVTFPEHHFGSFSWSPNPIQLLTWVAARTSRIALMPAVVIVPWHDPLRVIEEYSVLDNLTDGRVWVGLGRGFARVEYEGFRVDREEARGRFDEAAALIIRGLETGVAEGDGPFYPQPRVEIRPAPFKSFNGRVYSVANSPASAETAGVLGARLVNFVAAKADTLLSQIDIYRTSYKAHHGSEPPPVLLSDATFCTRDPKLAERARTEFYPANHRGVQAHYEYDTTDFSKIKGYESHDKRGLPRVSDEDFADTQVWGTPEEIVDLYRERIEIIGDCDAHFIFRHGGIPADLCEASMRLFAEEALPELKKLGVRTPATTAT